VAIWFDGDDVSMTVKGVEVPAAKQAWYWQRCMTRPVEEDIWRSVAEDGQPWPDMDEEIADTLGHNIAETTDRETLKGLLDKLVEAAKKYQTVGDDATAARAQSLRARLNELKGRSDKLREEEKAPHLKAGREVDAAWQPLVKAADAAALAIRKALEAHETDKRRAAVAAAEAARKAAEANVSRETPEPEIEAPVARVAGGYGRAASVRTKNVVVSIDADVVFRSYSANAEVIALLTKLAQRDLDAGITTPGCKVEERAIVS
jgi:hypothetical protein